MEKNPYFSPQVANMRQGMSQAGNYGNDNHMPHTQNPSMYDHAVGGRYPPAQNGGGRDVVGAS